MVIFDRYRSDDSTPQPYYSTYRARSGSGKGMMYGGRWLFYRDHQFSWGTWAETSYPQGEYILSSKEMWDMITPNYHELVQSKSVLPTNPMVVKKMESSGPQKHNVHQVRRYISTGLARAKEYSTDSYLGFPNYNDDIPPSAMAEAARLTDLTVASVNAKANRGISQTMVAIAEASKTARLLVDSVFGLAKVLKGLSSIRRGRLPNGRPSISSKEWKRLASSSGDLWMTARYGIRPTMYDIRDHQDALKQLLFNMRRPTTFRSSKESSPIEEVTESDFIDFPNFASVQYRTKTTRTTVVKVRSTMTIKPKTGVVDSTITTFGFHQWGTLSFELIPLSFVADWIFNFGDSIAQWERPHFMQVLNTSTVVEYHVTEKVEIIEISYLLNFTGADGWTMTSTKTSMAPGTVLANHSYVKVDRQVSPPRSLLPTLDLNFDILKAIDLTIIGRNIARSIKKSY